MTSPESRPALRHPLPVTVALAAAYFVAARLGLVLEIPGTGSTPVWPPSGIALAAMLVHGYRVWPAIAVGAFLANLLQFATLAIPVRIAAAAGISLGNTLEHLVAVWWLRRLIGDELPFRRTWFVFLFIAAASLGCLVASLNGSLQLWLWVATPVELLPRVELTWWLGDLAGMLVIAPLLLAWRERSEVEWTRARVAEATAQFLILATVSWLMMGVWVIAGPVMYVLVSLLLWVTFRFGLREATAAVAMVATIATGLTLQEQGPFSWHRQMAVSPDLPPETLRTESLLMLQVFLCVLAVTVMTLRAAVAERNCTEAELRELAVELKRQADERTSAEARFRATIEFAPSAMLLIAETGTITLLNAEAERLFGYSRQELIGQSVEVLVPERFRPQHPAYRTGYFADPQPGKMMGSGRDLFARRKDGSEIPVEIGLNPLRTDEGLFALAGVLNISERKRQREELERRVRERTAELEEKQRQLVHAERLAAIGETMTGLAHESRNALQRGQAALSILSHQLQDRPDALELVRLALEAQDDLHRLYEQVRAYAAPIRLDLGWYSLDEIVAEVWKNLQFARENRAARLRQTLTDGDARCWVDRFAIGQVFRNLLENSLEACPSPVEIAILWSRTRLNDQPALQARVVDSGPGLNGEQRSRLFEPFFTTKTRGTGLGMAIVRRIVEAHGGQVEVGPREPPGAEIVVRLPCRPAGA